MTGRFDDCLAHVLRFEGGYSDHPDDRGGATNKGITQATYDAWLAERDLTPRRVRDIRDFDVSGIYRLKYWKVCRCDYLPVPLDLVVFDAAVQHGPMRAIKWLQHCVGATPDGICGDETIAAVNAIVSSGRIDALVDEFMDTRSAFYAGIVARDPSQNVFQRGWANRMNALEEKIR